MPHPTTDDPRGEAAAPRPNPHIRATLERVHIQTGNSTSAWFWRRDLDLLRALYRGSPGGYSLHIRAAVHAMCEQLRADLRASDQGRNLLTKLGQDTNGQS